MKTIEIGKGCYGEYASVDDISVTMCTYYESRPDLKEKADDARSKILETIVSLKDKLNDGDWVQLLNIIVNTQDYDRDDHEYLNNGSCETCGDWNYKSTYTKIDASEEIENSESV